MKNVLAGPQRPILEQFSQSNVAVIFDYDGTLAPLVVNPERAKMRRSTRALLSRLASLYPCALLTGRAQEDAARFVEGVPLIAVVGNHGAEWGFPRRSRPATAAVARAKAILIELIPRLNGGWLEDKGYSLTVHLRTARPREKMREEVHRALAGLAGIRLLGGRDAVNVLPRGVSGKGAAIRRLCHTFGCGCAIFVGDDETDEEAFALGSFPVLGIRVGRSARSRAGYFLSRQAEIDELLRRLTALRSPPIVARRRSGTGGPR